MLGILFFIVAAFILFLHALDLLKGSINWEEMAAAFVVLGVAFSGTAIPVMPQLTLRKQE